MQKISKGKHEIIKELHKELREKVKKNIGYDSLPSLWNCCC